MTYILCFYATSKVQNVFQFYELHNKVIIYYIILFSFLCLDMKLLKVCVNVSQVRASRRTRTKCRRSWSRRRRRNLAWRSPRSSTATPARWRSRDSGWRKPSRTEPPTSTSMSLALVRIAIYSARGSPVVYWCIWGSPVAYRFVRRSPVVYRSTRRSPVIYRSVQASPVVYRSVQESPVVYRYIRGMTVCEHGNVWRIMLKI